MEGPLRLPGVADPHRWYRFGTDIDTASSRRVCMPATCNNGSRPGDALPHIRRAVELRTDDANAWFNLSNAQTALGDLPAAVHAFERALSLDRDRFKACNNLGIVLGGDQAAAEAAWRRSLAIRPDFPDTRLNLAKFLDSRVAAPPGAAEAGGP